MPLAPAALSDHKTRLLSFVEDLLEEMEALDLDTIDGEFYWRWCKADLLEPLTAVVPRLPRAVGGINVKSPAQKLNADNALSGIIEPEGLFDYLRESMRFMENLLWFTDRLSQQYPRMVWQRLLDGERVSMRAAEAEVRVHEHNGDRRHLLVLKVFSGAWTGKHVEDEARRWVALSRLKDVEARADTQGAMAVNLRFDFVSESQARRDAVEGEPLPSPHVLVEVPLPLPPDETIAREYEALVRRHRGWHLELPGSGSLQEKKVAIRTWTVGLLVHGGAAVNDAIGEVHERLDLGDVSQSCFGFDRKKLLERVPEAEPYLYAPMTGSLLDTRETDLDALVWEASSPGLTQPSTLE